MPQQGELAEVMRLVECLADTVSFYKVGLTLYTAAGAEAVRCLRGVGKRVFLDLKLHDIPMQVASAVGVAGGLDVELLTVHTAGGEAMLAAAATAAADSDLRLLGVTVLTSQSAAPEEVERRARLAISAGLDGVVCSAVEVDRLRGALGPGPLLVTPGIRPAPADGGGVAVGGDDQVRVATPQVALRGGATHLVVGRPITAAPDPVAAAEALIAAMQLGVTAE